MKIETTDILIVGTGAAGSTAAWNLSKSNFKITCLEQGPFINYKEYSFNNTFREIKKLYNFNSDPNLRNLKSGQLDKLNIKVRKNKLKQNNKKGIF